MSAPVLSNSLADLAARIKAEHDAYVAAIKQSLNRALAAGDMLIEAKTQLRHGEWLPWLAERCGIPERTASHYMRLARNRAKIEAEIGNVADLTVRGAAALLAPEPAEDAAPDILWPGERWLDIADVVVRRELYPRINILTDVIERYTHFVDDVPAIEVNQRNELIDGFMRLKAAERIGRKRIRAIVTEVADDMRHLEVAVYRNNDAGLQLPLHGDHRTLPDGNAIFVPGEIELRDDRRKELAMEAAGQPRPIPWHLKPVVELPDWLDAMEPARR